MEKFGKFLKERKLNKKGSLIDIIYIAVGLTFFSIIVLIGLNIAQGFEDNFDASPMATNQSKDIVDSTIVKYTNTIDNTFLFLTILMSLGVLILAALVRIHPIFIPIYFIGWILVIFLTGIFSNIYQAMAADANLAVTANELTFISGIMTTLPIIIGVIGIILMVVMYKLWDAGQI